MKKQIIFFFCLFLFSIQVGNAQRRISYAYDPAGNRISRTIILPQREGQSQAEKFEEEQKQFFDNLNGQEIKIYPNPTQGHLAIEIIGLDEHTTASLRLYTMKGNLITEISIDNPRTELNISNQPQGTYLLHIIIGNESTVWKIIKN